MFLDGRNLNIKLIKKNFEIAKNIKRIANI